MPALASETARRLTEEFYAWELRGRGWDLWPYPVVLEPPFRPFLFHGAHVSTVTAVDDGRAHTLTSRLIERLSRWLTSAPVHPAGTSTETDCSEPLPARSDASGSLEELALLVPADVAISPEASRRLLLSLSSLDTCIAFEVIGSVEGVRIQIACRNQRRQLADLVRAFVPEVSLAPPQLPLASLWNGLGETPPLVVDFGLSEEFVLPLSRLTPGEPDPLISLIPALSGFSEEELGVLQLLFSRVHNPWAASILRAVSDGQGGSFFADAPEVSRLAQEKVRSPLLAAVLRIGIKSPNESRRRAIARAVAAGLVPLASSGGNSLIPLSADDFPLALHEEALLERLTYRSGMLLSVDELVGLVHVPGPSLRSGILLRPRATTKAAPAEASGGAFVLGQNVHQERRLPVTLLPHERSRHVYVIGASGTGKSTLLLSMVCQDMEQGAGIAVLDPHGDLIDDVFARVPHHRIEDVILFDPSDEEYPVSFNILEAHSELERTILASDLTGVFRRLSTSWGDQMTAVLGNAVLAFLYHPEGGTLLELRRFLDDERFRRDYLPAVADAEVMRFWTDDFPRLSGHPEASILTRLNAFLRPRVVRNVVNRREGALDFGGIVNGGKVLLGKLSSGLIGEENAHLLGSLLVAKLHQVALSRQALPPEKRCDFYLYLDEFQQFVTPSMATLLEGARKYRMGLVLAHQTLRQLGKADEVASAALANAYTRVCFRLGDEDARRLAPGFSSFSATDLEDLATGQAIVRLGGARSDFNLVVQRTSEVDREAAAARRDLVRQTSRARFGRPVTDLERVSEVRPGTEAPVPEPLPISPEPQTPPRRPPPANATQLAGRGGPQHKYLQEVVKRLGEERGYRATVEQELADGGRVDVALESGARRIACEISVSSSPDQELANFRKCEDAAFDEVVFLFANRKQRSRVQHLVEAQLSAKQSQRVHFLLTEELLLHLDACSSPTSAETTVRGYRVRVAHGGAESDERSRRRNLVARVVSGSLRRMERKEVVREE
jgi:hypothetical protein